MFGSAQVIQKLDGLEKSVNALNSDLSHVTCSTSDIPEALTTLRKILREIQSEQVDVLELLAEVRKRQQEVLTRLARLEDEVLTSVTRVEHGVAEAALTTPASSGMTNEWLLHEIRDEFDELRHLIDLKIKPS